MSVSVRKAFIILPAVIPGSITMLAMISPSFLWLGIPVAPLVNPGYADILQKKQSIKRNFPVIGQVRYLLEKIRPEIMQYFVETDIEGRNISSTYSRRIIAKPGKFEIVKRVTTKKGLICIIRRDYLGRHSEIPIKSISNSSAFLHRNKNKFN